MDHDYINQFDLIDRYLMGRLAAAESERFEEHFVDCPECVARLQTSRDFIHDLRRSGLYQPQSTKELSPVKAFRVSPMALAAASVALIFAVFLFFGLKRMLRLQAEVDQARNTSAEWETRYNEERQAAALPEKARGETEDGSKNRIETKGQQEEQRVTDRSTRAAPPQINLPQFALDSVRGAPSASSDSVKQITLPAPPASFLLTVPLQGKTSHTDYRVTIVNSRRRVIWKASGYKPDGFGSLSSLFSASSLKPGSYTLTVEGLTKEKLWVTVGIYPFRAVKSPATR